MQRESRRALLLVPSLSYGDAVSNDVIGMAAALKSRGVDVRVPPSDVAAELGIDSVNVEGILGWLADPRDLLVYHYGGECDWAERIFRSARCRKILKYHNVTPAEFFDGYSEDYARNCRAGRERLPHVARAADIVWGDSGHNVSEVQASGFVGDLAVVPPFHHTNELLGVEPDREWLQRLGDGRPNILVVGRLAPNKNHLFLLKAFSLLRPAVPGARLIIAGARDERLGPYLAAIDECVARLGLSESVVLTGKVSSETLAALYRSAHLMAMPSLHEGFCVPVIEAMAFGVPVAAVHAAAVPETLGDAGIIVQSGAEDAFSEAMRRLLLDNGLAAECRARGLARYFRHFRPEEVEDVFCSAVSPLLAFKKRALTGIHQFHSGSAYGDAVTNSLFYVRGLLRDLGFESHIYVQHVAHELADDLLPHTAFRPSSSDALLVHHSMGHDLDAWLHKLECPKWLVYHNITPPSFFPEASPFRTYAEKGLRQLAEFRPLLEGAIADSPLNAREARDVGYDDVEVIPALIDVDSLPDRPWNEDLVQREAPIATVLFVGRVAPNKGQIDLVRSAAILRAMFDERFQLVLVGGYEGTESYFIELKDEIARLGLEDAVQVVGKVPDADLYAWYRSADVFVCLSRHEGFGVPLIEAMAFGVPVVALDAGNVAATLGEGGLLLRDCNHAAVAALVKLMLTDRALRRAVVAAQRRRVAAFGRASVVRKLANFLVRNGVSVPRMPAMDTSGSEAARLRFQVEGPFESSYSLAIVNRETALALDAATGGKAALFATEGPGDYPADELALRRHVGVAELWQRGRKRSGADVVLRNLYPPRVSDMDGRLNFLAFAWEESGLPAEWVAHFNRSLDAIVVPSQFVRKVLRDNGVQVPITVFRHGIDHLDRVPEVAPGRELGRGFRFLHVSSCFPRKGVDVLLDAYAEAFAGYDDVTLVIKTFPNPHNNVAERVETLRRRRRGCPPVVVIDEDLDASELKGLYLACDAFVAPTRGEGFGLPLAEAMWLGKPVITTAYGGQSDFCTNQTAWLVDYDFALAGSHLDIADSMWVEPKRESLIRQLRAVRGLAPEERAERVEHARALLMNSFTWALTADRILQTERGLSDLVRAPRPRLRVAWVSSWNAKCGIATYSSFLLKHFDPMRFDVTILASLSNEVLGADGPGVRRCWTDRFGSTEQLFEELDAARADAIVIQHNFAFFSTEVLAALVQRYEGRGVPVLVTFHSTEDVSTPGLEASLGTIANSLASATRLLVHSVEDVNRLKGWSLVNNVALFPHGAFAQKPEEKFVARRGRGIGEDEIVIASFGFMLPHKGIEELVDAFAKVATSLPKARLLLVNALYPGGASDETLRRVEDRIRRSGLRERVTMLNEFLEDEESLGWLACADLVVFPYQETAESASGAVRYGLASRRPVACTPMPIFDDMRDVVHFLPGGTADQIAAGLLELLRSPSKLSARVDVQQHWVECRSWPAVARRLCGLIEGVCEDSCGQLSRA